MSNIELEQVSSDLMNIRLKTSRITSRPYNVDNRIVRTRRPQNTLLESTLNSQTNHMLNFENDAVTTNPTDKEINNDSLKSIENIQHEKDSLEDSSEISNEQQAQIQRSMYNAKQLPLIPFIIDLDYRLLFDLSQEQNDLLTNILTLMDNIDEECSFFEQFKI